MRQLLEDIAQLLYAGGVEPVRRLVQHEQARTVEQCLRHAEALTHAEGVFCYLVVGARFKTDELYQLVDALTRHIVVHTAVKLEVFFAREIFVHLRVFDYTADA